VAFDFKIIDSPWSLNAKLDVTSRWAASMTETRGIEDHLIMMILSKKDFKRDIKEVKKVIATSKLYGKSWTM
jgi:hypothetical protein